MSMSMAMKMKMEDRDQKSYGEKVERYCKAISHLRVDDNDCDLLDDNRRKRYIPYIHIPSADEVKSIMEDDRIYLLLPFTTGGGDGLESTIPTTLDQLIQEAQAIKEHLEETHPVINADLSQFLLNSLDFVIHVVSHYQNETALPAPFDWNTGRFPKWAENLPCPVVKGNWCKFLENALKLSESGLVHPDFDSHGSETGNAYAFIPNQYHLGTRFAPMADLCSNEEGKKIWLEFKEFDKGNPEAEIMDFMVAKETSKSIALDHPIVSVIGDFSVVAFNKATKMHVKEKEPNNLHDFEFMECRYMKRFGVYEFYMTIEAIEEGNLGVYEAGAVCTGDGNMLTLTKFILTGRKPTGTKVTAISIFSFLRSVCKTLRGVTAEKERDLLKILHVAKGVRRGLPVVKLDCVSVLHKETIKGIHQLLTLGHRLIFSPDCSRISIPDCWSHPGLLMGKPVVT